MKASNKKKAEIPWKIKGFSFFLRHMPEEEKGTKIPFLSCYRKDLGSGFAYFVFSYDSNMFNSHNTFPFLLAGMDEEKVDDKSEK